MARNKKMVTMTLPHELVARLKAWIARQDTPLKQNAVVEHAITQFLDGKEGSNR